MSTKSILKNVHITDTKSAEAFILALEKAEITPGENVTLSHPCSDASRKEIREMFANQPIGDSIC